MAFSDSKEYTPILPYDVTLGEHFDMYDHKTYHKDNNMCNQDTVHKMSGNVVKHFSCKIAKPCKIGGD